MRILEIVRLVAVACALAVGSSGCNLNPGTEPWPDVDSLLAATPVRDEREACLDRNPLGNAYFGDLHVHTVHSFDANLRGTRGRPDDVYRFARGEPLAIAPYDENGRGLRTEKLERPLDFAAVTDHAEWLGEVSVCTTPGSPTYDSSDCRVFRGETSSFLERVGVPRYAARIGSVVGFRGRNKSICGDDLSNCRAALSSVWGETRAAAERHYDRSQQCDFTTFNAWEYSYTPDRSKTHRNVIFRGNAVPELPMSWTDRPTPLDLWEGLQEECLNAGTGCDVLAIPHNPNLSNGRTFTPTYTDEPLGEQRRQARLRAELEPLVEMMQIKGESECLNGMWGVASAPDELCDFEKRRGLNEPVEDCRDGIGSGGDGLKGCISRLDFVRFALTFGLSEQERLGVNPYKLGLIGSTDTHNATPGATDEWSYPGGNGLSDATVLGRLGFEAGLRNPGGLVGVWAQENSREALFDAMRRRETFATSGTRIQPRFFGGWGLAEDLCHARDWVQRVYAEGVPMGSDLPHRPNGAGAPAFAVAAVRDPGTLQHPGGFLERIQIVKGWVDEDGQLHEAVYHAAGARQTTADVDLDTCTPRGSGADELCDVWRDPDFDPSRSAVYYARVVENPSCRWQTYSCLKMPEEERPEACSDPTIPHVIQERGVVVANLVRARWIRELNLPCNDSAISSTLRDRRIGNRIPERRRGSLRERKPLAALSLEAGPTSIVKRIPR